MNRQIVFQSYFDGFNEQEMFDFLYQSNYRNYEVSRFYPTERQVIYIAALLTDLEIRLQFYGVEFKYRNGNKSLPKTKSKFRSLKSYNEIDLIIGNLKLLLSLLDQYKNEGTLNLYTQIECSMSVINKYFIIPNITKLKQVLKSKLDVREIEAEKARKNEERMKEEQKKKKRAEELERKRWLKGFSQPTVYCEVDCSRMLLESAINEAGRVSRNQVYSLSRQIEEAICFVKIIDSSNVTFRKPYTLDGVPLMTKGEAGLFLNILKEFNSLCWKEVENVNNQFAMNVDRLLTSEFLELVELIGGILPYFKDVSEGLSPLSNAPAKHLKLKERICQLTRFLKDYQVEMISLDFKSVFEKRHFLYLLHKEIQENLVEGMTEEWIHLIDETDMEKFLIRFVDSCEFLSDSEKQEITQEKIEELALYTKETLFEFMRLDGVI